jgi:hypothetical protein
VDALGQYTIYTGDPNKPHGSIHGMKETGKMIKKQYDPVKINYK